MGLGNLGRYDEEGGWLMKRLLTTLIRSETENKVINDICELVASDLDKYGALQDNPVRISYLLDKNADPDKKTWTYKCC